MEIFFPSSFGFGKILSKVQKQQQQQRQKTDRKIYKFQMAKYSIEELYLIKSDINDFKLDQQKQEILNNFNELITNLKKKLRAHQQHSNHQNHQHPNYNNYQQKAAAIDDSKDFLDHPHPTNSFQRRRSSRHDNKPFFKKNLLQNNFTITHTNNNNNNTNDQTTSEGSESDSIHHPTHNTHNNYHNNHHNTHNKSHNNHQKADAQGWVTLKNRKKSFGNNFNNESRDKFRKEFQTSIKPKLNSRSLASNKQVELADAIAEKPSLKYNAFSALGDDEDV